ncbi:MAG: hydroxymethylglutaryl-CoA reductase, degradative [Candidatus Nealsonbacteria bacterium CG08_land_8_20_14_0_20_38_20]|uniref:3-hydroxy-3-methylglutaryl coenzyme A reductase n=1 Tax=Candidatus Nealsonbacteria bacterium CG08_land_8_20_14_0_20_38_20 TaxID=1974705 RepID=A0A2H0YLR6_9BACT|nr:MAG: hydroxymethylglutaryl-CoA reductase, degradative [Candidatus Nealsonbacteria bacterium CG08_land_8_20_14_0_20_38_20]
MISSAIPNFHKFPLEKKIGIMREFSNLNQEDLALLKKYQKLPDFTDFENNIGPFKIGANFLINGKDYFAPMEIEEPSVVAAASRAARQIREGGGFKGRYLGNQMTGQLQMLGIKNFKKAGKKILENKNEILKIANQTNEFLLRYSGGAKDLEVRKVKNFLVLHLFVNPKDAMGANIVNTMLEKIAPFVSKITGAKIGVRIISNFAERRVVFVEGKVPIEKLAFKNFSGREATQGILMAQELADSDIYRAVTHNKGVMNGIDAVALATGNDFRAIEAGIHSFAAKTGKYKPITNWKLKNNFLKGEIKIPLPIATVGGATSTKKAKLALKILRVKNAQELGVVAASVGLANNLAALSVLGTEGIQKGHMRFHKNFIRKMI